MNRIVCGRISCFSVTLTATYITSSLRNKSTSITLFTMKEMPPTYIEGFHDKESVEKMEYLELGKTELLISKISMGTATLSYFYGYVCVCVCNILICSI